MNMLKLSIKNTKNNLKIYKLYFIAMIFSVLIYFQFVSLKYNPEILSMNNISQVKDLGLLTQLLMLVFVAFFLIFADSFFIGERKKEIGLYILMGVVPQKIGFLFGLENCVMYALSTIFGIGLGILVNKLFLMVLAAFLDIGVTIKLSISFMGILETILTFAFFALVISARGYFIIVRSSVINLIKGKNKEEKLPKGNYLVGLLSLFCIAGGYYASNQMFTGDFLIFGLLAVLLVIIGTFLFFRSAMTILLRIIMMNKAFVYKHGRIITFSQLWYRIGTNSRVYAAVTIFLTTTIVAFAIAASLNYGLTSMEEMKYPYSLSYLTDESNKESFNVLMNDFLVSQQAEVNYQVNNLELLLLRENVIIDGSSLGLIGVVKYSDFKNLMEDMNYKSSHEVLIKDQLKNGEALYVNEVKTLITLFDVKKVNIEESSFDILKSFKAPIFGSYTPDIILVNDHDFSELAAGNEIIYCNGYKFSNERAFFDRHKEELDTLSGQSHVEMVFDDESIKEDYVFFMIRLFYILSIFMCLTFIISTSSIIYFKIYSQAIDDKEIFNVLYRIGMDKGNLEKLIHEQTLMFFAFPLLMASLHCLAAMKNLEAMMGLSLTMPIFVSIFVIGAIFFGYFLLTVKMYKKIVI